MKIARTNCRYKLLDPIFGPTIATYQLIIESINFIEWYLMMIVSSNIGSIYWPIEMQDIFKKMGVFNPKIYKREAFFISRAPSPNTEAPTSHA